MIEKYEKACRIAAETLAEGKKLAKPGMPLLELAEKLESIINEKGAKPAFPVNLSINDAAAHYTPAHEDKSVIGEKDVLKIDVGAQIDGFIGDTALTIDFSGENGKLLEAAERGLEAAIATARAGVKIGEIGAAVESEIKKLGFKPIENLTGHSLGQYTLHAGTEIPNIRTAHTHTLKEGDVIAIEPFATNGAGHVRETNVVEIYALESPQPVRMREARRLLSHAADNYRTLPFAERWLYKHFHSKLLLTSALRELVLNTTFRQYPVLKDAKGGLVSQAEHTVVIEKDSARILTR